MTSSGVYLACETLVQPVLLQLVSVTRGALSLSPYYEVFFLVCL